MPVRLPFGAARRPVGGGPYSARVMLRLVHTSDWHLGHALHGISREHEHACFLRFLEQVLREERPHALLITGDVFDTATPSAHAERTLFDLLARVRAEHPTLAVVIIGGNHDSAPRLEAPSSLLRAHGVHVVASLRRRPGAPLDLERLVVPLRGGDGEVAAWLATVPFLRPADFAPRAAGGTAGASGVEPPKALLDAVREVYDEVLAHARARRAPGQALLATGHLTLVGATISDESERPVLGGVAALTCDLFPDDLAYVALGHLHKAQAVGDREGVRYAGSPIPLSMTEADYVHQVVVVDIEAEGLARVRPRPVPRTVPLLRLPPAGGPADPESVLALLRALPDASDTNVPDLRPLVEVRVSAPAPEPGLRRRVEEALEGRAARLVRVSVTAAATTPEVEARTLAEAAPHARLTDLEPGEVFTRCWQREHEGLPPADLVEAFEALLAEVRTESRRDVRSDVRSDDAPAPAAQPADDAAADAPHSHDLAHTASHPTDGATS